VTPSNEVAKLLASDGAATDNFGYSVAVAGDTAVIGARDDDNGNLSGSAYVFVRDSTGAWAQQAKLLPSDGAAGDYFGDSVALAGDTAVIGAYGDDDFSGSAYVFVRDGTGAWTEQAKLIASDRELYESSCGSVGVSGTTVVTGAPYHDVEGAMNAGAAYVFSSVDAEGPPPSVTGIWTSAAPLVGQTISLFVFGNYFDTAPSGTQVSINEIPQLLVQVVTPEMLIVRVNPVTSGMIGGPVEVCTTSGCAMSEPPYFGDTLAGVNITGIWPASASVGEFVFVFGSGYEFPISVVIGATPVPLVQVVSPDMFIMLVPAGASTGPLWVMTPSGAATSAEDLIIVP
jgi:hypothetical protein